MTQRLLDTAPAGYYTHNTGGEHAVRVYQDASYVQQLHDKLSLPPLPHTPYDYARYHDGYVMIHPENPDGNGAARLLAGYVAAERFDASPYGFGYDLASIVVDPDFRGRHLGSFLLGKLASKIEPCTNPHILRYPERVTVDTAKTAEQVYEWLLSRGFYEEDGKLELLLPGTYFMSIPSDKITEMREKMPEDWTGVLEVVPVSEDAVWYMEAYRDGKLVGTAKHDTAKKSDFVKLHGQEHYVRGYRLEPTNSDRSTGLYTSELFAAIDLLNPPTN